MNKKNILFVFISLLISSAIFLVGYQKTTKPIELYRVYLKGETIGYIKNIELLEKYIDNEQTEIKEKYNVDKVFLPNDLDIKKEITYGKKVSTEKEIYEKIKDISPFTIEGYKVTIKGLEVSSEENPEGVLQPDIVIYVLDKDVFNKALKTTVNVFVSEKDYNNFVNKTQPEIKDVGTIIEDVYVKNKILVSESRISTEDNIFTSAEELSKFLLFGTTEAQASYVVQAGESIKDVVAKNRLSVSEFLIVNPEFTAATNLLYEGEKVNVGLINPQFVLVEENHTVELQEEIYETKIEYDNTMLVGYERVKQNGVNGTAKITKKIQKENGNISSVVVTKREIVKPSIPKIILKGNVTVPKPGNVGTWAWPTIRPYCITSGFEWRVLNGVRSHHDAIDISCSGRGSPIYAANNGLVEVATFHKTNGNYVILNHNNGFYSLYAHMDSLKVVPGQVVSIGQQIGTMGATGYAFGTHLHFAISAGYPFRGTFYDPRDFY